MERTDFCRTTQRLSLSFSGSPAQLASAKAFCPEMAETAAGPFYSIDVVRAKLSAAGWLGSWPRVGEGDYVWKASRHAATTVTDILLLLAPPLRSQHRRGAGVRCHWRGPQRASSGPDLAHRCKRAAVAEPLRAGAVLASATGLLCELTAVLQPEVPVLSYLEPLTGLSAALLEAQGQPLAAAVATLKQALPPAAVLVGTNIRADAQWLGLREGVDYASLVDLGGLFRVWNPQYKSWSVFGQDHLARVLLGVDAGT